MIAARWAPVVMPACRRIDAANSRPSQGRAAGRKLVPGIESNDRLQHRRQIFGLTQHAAPLVEPGILVPIEIINQRILFGRHVAAGAARPCCILDRRVRSGEHRVDGRIVNAGKILGGVSTLPFPIRISRDRDRAPDGIGGRPLVRTARPDL